MISEPLERRQNPNLSKSFTIFGVLLLLAATSLVVMSVSLIRLNSLVEDNKTSSEYLIECTTPGPNPPPVTGHKCFDDGQVRTGAAIKQIIDALREQP